jgi:hypothetical protein
MKWLQFVSESGWDKQKINAKLFSMRSHDLLSANRVAIKNDSDRFDILIDLTQPNESACQYLHCLPAGFRVVGVVVTNLPSQICPLGIEASSAHSAK